MTSYHVLVPIDTNERRVNRQIDHVLSLPDAPDSVRATLLHVHATVSGDAGTERIGDRIEETDVVEGAQTRLADGDIEVEYREEEGDVADTIIEVTERLAPDVVVVAGRKRSPVGKALFGSVSQRVILNADCAVTVVK
jgi:nucleotide-binding universal stress UspA family protein